jgi:hypothetical protein
VFRCHEESQSKTGGGGSSGSKAEQQNVGALTD